jgi:hypothetical protein
MLIASVPFGAGVFLYSETDNEIACPFRQAIFLWKEKMK